MSDQTPSSYYPEDIPYQPPSDYPADNEQQGQAASVPADEKQQQVKPPLANGTPSSQQTPLLVPEPLGTYASPDAYNTYETMKQKPTPQIEPGSSMAVSGFTLSFVSLISWLLPTALLGLPIPILGIVFSALGLRSTLRHKMALVGLIISIIGLLIHIITIALIILTAMSR